MLPLLERGSQRATSPLFFSPPGISSLTSSAKSCPGQDFRRGPPDSSSPPSSPSSHPSQPVSVAADHAIRKPRDDDGDALCVPHMAGQHTRTPVASQSRGYAPWTCVLCTSVRNSSPSTDRRMPISSSSSCHPTPRMCATRSKEPP